MYRTDEYRHLLAAERTLAEALQSGEGKLSERSQCARALVDIVRLKRDMRGIPDPKPIDVSEKHGGKHVRGPKWSPARIIDVSPTPQVPATSPDPGPASGQTPQ